MKVFSPLRAKIKCVQGHVAFLKVKYIENIFYNVLTNISFTFIFLKMKKK